jgi:hypothetical protein
VQEVGQETNICAVSSEPSGHLHVTVPTSFSGRKKDFKCFHQQIGLFITTNENDFKTDKLMILFMLSYMTIGLAELQANAFVNEALEMGDWGLWSNLLEMLAQDFGDSKEPCWALEEIGQMYQGKRTAAKYFLRLEQVTGINVDKSSHVLLQIKKSINLTLINQLYQFDEAPHFYSDYK